MPGYSLHMISNELRRIQKPTRYEHTCGVMYTSASLAMAHGGDIDKALIAGLLHDCAKHVPNDEIALKCNEAGILITEFERNNPHLLHGKLGAYYARELYGISDNEILLAIEHHTRGRAEMSFTEQIVFIADFIEPNRRFFEGLDIIRKTAFENMDICTCLICRSTFRYLKSRSMPVDETALNTYNYYQNISKQ